jgi:hypothetical protein
MTVQQNPFVYGRPITREEDLADREDEKRSMRGVSSASARWVVAPMRCSLIVQHQQRLLLPQDIHERAEEWAVRLLAYPKRCGHRLRHQRPLRERSKLHEPYPVRVSAHKDPGYLQL